MMAADADITVDLEALGFDYVTLASGTDDTDGMNPNTLVLDNMAEGGTVALEGTQDASAAQASTQVNVIDAATNAADSLNVSVSTATGGLLTVADVETVNVTSTDTDLSNNAGLAEANTLALAADSATTLVADGNANLDLGDLASHGSVNVTTLDASVNAYSTITDLESGDTIDLADNTVFSSAQVELADTAVFQDYANEAVSQLGTGEATWFQFGGDTFVVEELNADTDAFVNGDDGIIKIDGESDLSLASYNQTQGTLEIA